MPRHEVIIDTVNNRAPKFNQENYNVLNVSRTLPIGLNLDILNLYGIEAWVQDIDIDYLGNQIDDTITLTIKGKTHNLRVAFFQKVQFVFQYSKKLS